MKKGYEIRLSLDIHFFKLSLNFILFDSFIMPVLKSSTVGLGGGARIILFLKSSGVGLRRPPRFFDIFM